MATRIFQMVERDVVILKNQQKAFSKKALEYYNRMEEGSDLQKKYAEKKEEI